MTLICLHYGRDIPIDIKIKVNNSLFVNNLSSFHVLIYTFIKGCRLWRKPIKVLR